MFSTVLGESVTIEPTWKSERSMKSSEAQTNELEVKDAENQSVSKQSTEVQTDSLMQTDTIVFAPYDESSLSAFLKRVGPSVCRELERANRSKAFANYDKHQVETEDALQKLFTLHCPSFIEKELECTSLSWNSTGTLIAAAYGKTEHDDWCQDHGGICTWNVNQTNLKHDQPSIRYEHRCCITCLKFHPEEPSLLIGGSFIGEILLWNLHLEDDKLITVSPVGNLGHKESVTSIAWIKDVNAKGNKYSIISCGLDGRILVWKQNSRTNQLELRNGFLVLAENLPRSLRLKSSRMDGEIGVTSISFNVEDLEVFIIGTEGGGIFQCSLTSTLPVVTTAEFSIPLHNPVTLSYEPHKGRINNVQCSLFTRNIFMTCGSDGELRIYAMHQSKPVLQLMASEQFCIAKWSPTRPVMLFAITTFGQLHLYNLGTNKASSILSSELNDTKIPAWLVEMNEKDSKIFATATQDGKIQIWSLEESLLLSSANEMNFMLELGKINID